MRRYLHQIEGRAAGSLGIPPLYAALVYGLEAPRFAPGFFPNCSSENTGSGGLTDGTFQLRLAQKFDDPVENVALVISHQQLMPANSGYSLYACDEATTVFSIAMASSTLFCIPRAIRNGATASSEWAR